MQAGQLTTLVTIKRCTAGVDSIGQPLTTWTQVAIAWANVRNLRGVEAIKAGANVSTVSTSIRARWITGIDAGMRIIAGGVVYEIKAVLPDAVRREYVDFVCEVVA